MITMKKVLHQNRQNTWTVQAQVDPPPIPLIKSNNYDKLGKYFVKIKVHWDPMSENSDLYEFKMDLFDNGDPEDLLFFIHNFNKTLEASGTLGYGAKI